MLTYPFLFARTKTIYIRIDAGKQATEDNFEVSPEKAQYFYKNKIKI